MKQIIKIGSIGVDIQARNTNLEQKIIIRFMSLKIDFLLLDPPSTSLSKLSGNISCSDDFTIYSLNLTIKDLEIISTPFLSLKSTLNFNENLS